ncbi:MAG: hypothetical protein ACI9YO_003317 [Gammaproteobacteria bacterium]|jgi:hypothetical protein
MKIAIFKIVTLMIAVVFLYSCGDGKTDSGGTANKQVVCALNQILANGLCSACLIDEVTVNNRCIACASNEINVNNMCMACSSNEIVENNSCIACGSNEIIENNSCVACAAGQQVVNGFCETIETVTPDPDSMCPANSSLSGSNCRCASNYRATTTSIGSVGRSCSVYPGDAAHSGGSQTPNSCSGCHSVEVRKL